MVIFHNGLCLTNIIKIRAQDSHADIIVWPLLALGEYLERTNDQAILDK